MYVNLKNNTQEIQKNILDSIESKKLTEVSIKCKKFNAQQIGRTI